MEEVAVRGTVLPGPPADGDAPTLVGQGPGQELEEDAYEIEDEFLPSMERNAPKDRKSYA
ncbi:hypothetical protein BGZ80_007171 [Entomortierella chlamydospora]|uniref:Uncharacterized protein n=1 Tax=Entomortierella chlamydospora TaxID=101097 RepID=A0A9P6MFI7_9FUNG|nr:hypothetical protein BGZ80_007171 [Entomortierella chlamydospora]